MFYTQFLAIILGFTFIVTSGCSEIPPLKSEINNYSPIFMPLYDTHKQLKIAIRSYENNSIRYFVIVDPYTLKTQVVTANATQPYPYEDKGSAGGFPVLAFAHTPYLQALHQYTSSPYKLQNYGAISSSHPTKGVFLTVDMCPSTKSFAKQFFEELLSLYEKNQRAVPVALSVSGLWMIVHKEEFAWLKEQDSLGKLDITWVNHSFHHPYDPKAPNEHNFLLMHEENFEQEVLDTEKILLENQLVPSVFFRFPGLISNENLVKKLQKMSLIPLGSDAWLGKGEGIRPGSFILVHGNGNEPQGIKILMPLLSNLDLLPIQQAFTDLSPK